MATEQISEAKEQSNGAHAATNDEWAAYCRDWGSRDDDHDQHHQNGHSNPLQRGRGEKAFLSRSDHDMDGQIWRRCRRLRSKRIT